MKRTEFVEEFLDLAGAAIEMGSVYPSPKVRHVGSICRSALSA